MNTPIIANLIPRLRETVTQHLQTYIGGEGELSSIQDSLEFWWDGIRDRDFPDLPMWSDLPAPDRDALFDAWIEAVEEFFALRRKAGGDPVASSLPVSVAQEVSERTSHIVDMLKLAVNCDIPLVSIPVDDCLELLAWRQHLDRLLSSPPAASCASPAPLVPEVVKAALEALETCVWSGSIGGGKEYDEEKVESALTSLRSYSPVPSPSVELLREITAIGEGLEDISIDAWSGNKGFMNQIGRTADRLIEKAVSIRDSLKTNASLA